MNKKQLVKRLKITPFLLFTLLLLFTNIYSSLPQNKIIVEATDLTVEFNDRLESRVISKLNGRNIIMGDYSNSEYLTKFDGSVIDGFTFMNSSENPFSNSIGKGKEFVIVGSNDNLIKKISIKSYDDFPSFLLYKVTYKNVGKNNVAIEGWTNNNYNFSSEPTQNDNLLFWSYQPGSYGWENDWLQKLSKGFERENYLGMNHIDYGGGTPILDIWRKDVGMAIGHLETVPKLVSLPTSVNDVGVADIAITYSDNIELMPGDSLTTFNTFVSVHTGDYYKTLTDYSRFMAKQGIDFDKAPEGAYGTEWCGWGFEEKFTMEQFYGALPMVKKLGIDWATLDMGWEERNYGEYNLPKDRFPNGDTDMRNIVDSIHTLGLKARLWWMPLSVYPTKDMYKQHPEYVLLDKNQSPVIIEFWKSYFLCPASEEVKKLTKEFVIRAIKDWGWDGLKIDGNNLNQVPPCYNPAHNHSSPNESVEQLPQLYKIIYETAKSINPNVVIQLCPCGTNQSFFFLPYINQTVASDPNDSWHVRLKGKTLMGLTREKIPYAGDHVELSDDKEDFASTVGIGGVIATKFVWPVGSHENQETGDIALTSEKEAKWEKWITIYNEHKLSEGDYLGELYDIGFDRPETHAIKKDNKMYYAFYGDNFEGNVQLRGLDEKTYKIIDYENNKDLGEVTGPTASLNVKFDKHLLIEAVQK